MRCTSARTWAFCKRKRLLACWYAATPSSSIHSNDTVGSGSIAPGTMSTTRQPNAGTAETRTDQGVPFAKGSDSPAETACAVVGPMLAGQPDGPVATPGCGTPLAFSSTTRHREPGTGATRPATSASTAARIGAAVAVTASHSGNCSPATTMSLAVPVTKSWWFVRASSRHRGASCCIVALPPSACSVAKVSAASRGRAASRTRRFSSPRVP